MFKFELDQEVFYMNDNRVHSSRVFKREYQDVIETNQYSVQKTKVTIRYRLNKNKQYGYRETQLFATKQELLESL